MANERPNKPITPEIQEKPVPEMDPERYEAPERDPQPASMPRDLPPDPDDAGHDIEVEGP